MSEITLGYACINLTLGTKSRTMRLANFDLATVREKARANLDDVIAALQWATKHKHAHLLRFYRISSDLFPHIANPRAPELEKLTRMAKASSTKYNLTPFAAQFRQIGEIAEKARIRLTWHANPYIQLGSPKPEVVASSTSELNHHADMAHYIRAGSNPHGKYVANGMVIVIHLGGTYGDISSTKTRWFANFKKLPRATRALIVLENTETVPLNEIEPLARALKIPIVFDIFHHQINDGNDTRTISEILNDVKSTWPAHRRMKVHISNQDPNKTIGAHAPYVKSIPPEFLNRNHPLDIMVEAKQKEKAVLKLIDAIKFCSYKQP